MINTEITYNLSSADVKINHFKNEPGTMDIYPDRLVLYRKSRVVVAAFGLIGSAIEGKGKEILSVTLNMVSSFEIVNRKSNGKYLACNLILRDGQRLIIYPGLHKNAFFALDEFLSHVDMGRRGQPHSENVAYNSGPQERSAYREQAQQRNMAGNSQPRQSMDTSYGWQGHQTMQFCPFCGKQMENDSLFCGYCGKSIPGMSQQMNSNHDQQSAEIILGSRLSYADELMLAYRYDEELNMLRDLEHDFPGREEVIVRIGRNYRNRGDYQNAEMYYGKAYNLNQNDPLVQYELYRLYEKQNRSDTAISFLEKAVWLLDENPELLSSSMRGRIYSSYALCVGKSGNMQSAYHYMDLAERAGYDPGVLQRMKENLEMSNR